jgi:hypothetical protein
MDALSGPALNVCTTLYCLFIADTTNILCCYYGNKLCTLSGYKMYVESASTFAVLCKMWTHDTIRGIHHNADTPIPPTQSTFSSTKQQNQVAKLTPTYPQGTASTHILALTNSAIRTWPLLIMHIYFPQKAKHYTT